MAGSLPLLVSRGNAQAQYPLTRRVRFSTKRQQFQNGTEQRWASINPPLVEFSLVYTRITATDRNAIDAFAASQKGAFDSTWSFTLGAQTYTNCTLDSDYVAWSENPSGLFSGTLQFHQTVPGGAISGAGTSYPVLTSTALVQMPFLRAREWYTSNSDMPTGLQYSYGHYGTGLTSFPNRDLRRWPLGYSALTETDAAAIEAHFIQQQGMVGQFSFTDPFDGTTVYAKTRYGADVLEFKYVQLGQVQAQVLLEETN